MIHEETDHYIIATNPTGQDYIQCKTCGMRSYSQGDIHYLFCLKCEQFHPRQIYRTSFEESSESTQSMLKYQEQAFRELVGKELSSYMKAYIISMEGYEFLFKHRPTLDSLFERLIRRMFRELDLVLKYYITSIKERQKFPCFILCGDTEGAENLVPTVCFQCQRPVLMDKDRSSDNEYSYKPLCPDCYTNFENIINEEKHKDG